MTREIDIMELIRSQISGHPAAVDCPDMECVICGVRDCPTAEPFHYHHDGCPACWRGIQSRVESAK